MLSKLKFIWIYFVLNYNNIKQGKYYEKFQIFRILLLPTLPATTLAAQCYNSMFSGCTSLTTVENLPNALLENKCYEKMFSYCSSLRSVKIGYKGNFTTDYFYNLMEGGHYIRNS